MAKESRKRGRPGTVAAQFFLNQRALSRFRAACALRERDPAEALESLMLGFADESGIPRDEPPKPKKPAH